MIVSPRPWRYRRRIHSVSARRVFGGIVAMLTVACAALVAFILVGYAYFWIRVLLGLAAVLIQGAPAAPVGQPSRPGAFPPYAR